MNEVILDLLKSIERDLAAEKPTVGTAKRFAIADRLLANHCQRMPIGQRALHVGRMEALSKRCVDLVR